MKLCGEAWLSTGDPFMPKSYPDADRRSSPPSRPALRYHGGKWVLAKWLLSLFPAHRIYVEPFGGAASVLLRKPRSYAEIYNDLDSELVNLFRVLRDRGQAQALRDALSLTPFARMEFDLSYEPIGEPVELARRTIVRSFMGFGSDGVNSDRKTGFRANSNRSGTTPAHDWANWPRSISSFTERLRGVVIECRDALDVIKQHDSPCTLHYVDPPYVHAARKSPKAYRHEMTEADHERLAETLYAVEGMVLLSGYDSDLYRTLYSEWHRVESAAFADGARSRTEVVWMNARAASRQPQITIKFEAST